MHQHQTNKPQRSEARWSETTKDYRKWWSETRNMNWSRKWRSDLKIKKSQKTCDENNNKKLCRNNKNRDQAWKTESMVTKNGRERIPWSRWRAGSAKRNKLWGRERDNCALEEARREMNKAVGCVVRRNKRTRNCLDCSMLPDTDITYFFFFFLFYFIIKIRLNKINKN